MTTIGYARVSTSGQTLAKQNALLKKAGAERIVAEKVSGVTNVPSWSVCSITSTRATPWSYANLIGWRAARSIC
jgi:hypothetical protein